MKRDLLVRGGTLVTEHNTYRADIHIRDGKIAAIYEPGAADGITQGESSVPVLDATGCHVLPGVIDGHVHFRDPGLTHKEDFSSGSAAAAAGGVTTVLDMPNTVPPVGTARLLEEKMAAIAGRSYVDYGIYGVITEGNADQLEPMAKAGACAFKLFLGPTTGDIRPPELGALLHLFQTLLPGLGLPVVVHAEDRSVIETAQSRLQSEGKNDYAAFLASRPRLGEIVATDTAIRLAEASGVPVHIAHVALAEAVEAIAHHKARGVPITAETCPHYLYLNRDDAQRLGPEFKILPPVRERTDSEALWKGIEDGVIDMIATDHAPHLTEEKENAPDIWAVPAGSLGVETLFPLTLDAVGSGRLTLSQVVRLLSAAPARIFGLYPEKGAIRPGADGDLVIVDLDARTVIDETKLHSKVKRSLFHGREIQGAVRFTVLRGRIVAEDGRLVGQPEGRILKGRGVGS